MNLFGVDFSSVTLTCGLVTLIIVLLTYLQVTKYRFWSKQGIDGPTPWPLFGNILEFFTSGSAIDSLNYRWEKYGPIHGLYTIFTPQLVAGDPDMIKDIFVRDWHVFADRTTGKKSGDPVFDNFLTVKSGNEWKRMRSIISPTFTSGKMKSMFHIMNDCGKLMVENIKKKIRNQNDGKYELDMRHISGCYTMDVIAKCCFATDTNSFDDPNQVFVTYAKKFNSITKWQLVLIILRFTLPARVRNFFGINGLPTTNFFKDVSKTVLEHRRKDGISSDQLYGYTDYLQLLINASKRDPKANDVKDNEDTVPDHESHHGHEGAKEIIADTTSNDFDFKRPLTDDEIISNSVLFLVVGYDTTGSLITSAIYLITCNQDEQTKLYEELFYAYKNHGNELSYETVTGLKYLDAVISETLRLLPPAPLAERRPMKDYTFKKNGIRVPSGGSVVLPIWNLHHDPTYWPDPEKFDPGRFLPKNRDNITPFTYIPFGGGPRNCVGMRFALLEAKLAIAHLVLNFKFITCEKTDIPLDLSPTLGLLNPKRVFVGVEER